jgi:type VI secretion system protein ImpE
MDARDYLRDGDLDAALKALQAQVRSEPANAKLRVFLFQLLCVNGDWDRALSQLNVAGELDAGTLGMVQVYREALRNEALREEVFAGRKTPLIFGDPERWVALLLEALRLTAEGEAAKGQALRDEAFELAPASRGRLNGAPFEWIADADARLGPVLEAIVNGRYYWVPFARIADIKIAEPQDLRDLIWAPVELKWTNGGDAVAFIPTRYPGSEAHKDPMVRLARRTEWQELANGGYVGFGQRLLATDAGEHALMEVRDINLEIPNRGGSAATEGND